MGYELDSFCSARLDTLPGHVYAPALGKKHVSYDPVATRRGGYGHRLKLRAGLVDTESKELVKRCECFSHDPYECG